MRLKVVVHPASRQSKVQIGGFHHCLPIRENIKDIHIIARPLNVTLGLCAFCHQCGCLDPACKGDSIHRLARGRYVIWIVEWPMNYDAHGPEDGAIGHIQSPTCGIGTFDDCLLQIRSSTERDGDRGCIIPTSYSNPAILTRLG